MFEAFRWVLASLRRREAISNLLCKKARKGRTPRLGLEMLEDRLAPAILTVNTLADSSTPGDTTLSLREAIAAVNTQDVSNLTPSQLAHIDTTQPLGTNDTIQFDASLNGTTIALTLGEFSITDPVTIDGSRLSAGITLDGGGASRIFSVSSGVTLALDALTLCGGNGTGATASGSGGALYVASNGTADLTGCTITGNSATGDGGGILNAGTLAVSDSTISSNVSAQNGGGVANDCTATLLNSTVSGNSSQDAGGGFFSDGTSATFTNATVALNQSDPDGNGFGDGGIDVFGATVTLNNTIVAGNVQGAAGSTLPADVGDGAIDVADSFNNLIGDNGSSGALTDGVNGNIVGINGNGTRPITTILDTTLADNGGPTQTLALLSNSPAINAGSNSLVPSGVTTDQRGFNRIVGTSIDVGAFEFSSPATQFSVSAPQSTTAGSPFSVTVTALDAFNNNTSYVGTVFFTKSDSGTGSSVPSAYTFVAGDNGTHAFSNGVTFVTAGNQTLTATDDSGSITGTATVAVNADGTTTSLGSLANPSVFGQTVTFQATVSANDPGSDSPAGTVTFMLGNTTLGTGTLSTTAGVTTASYTTAAFQLSVGSNQAIAAVYGGDSNFTSSVSTILTQGVNKDDTTTSLESSSNPSVFGQTVTFQATVSANAPGSGSPAGTVTFKLGSTTLGTGTLSTTGGVTTASYTTTAIQLPVGSNQTIAVSYGGGSNFTSSTGATPQTVLADQTNTSVTSSSPTGVVGQWITYTATVSVNAPGSGSPTGTVTFKDTKTNATLGTVPLVIVSGSGMATLQTVPLVIVSGSGTATLQAALTGATGSHTITATYNGSGNDVGGGPVNFTETVSKTGNRANSVKLSSSTSTPVVGQAVTFTAKVTAGATGTVTFEDGTTVLGFGTLNTIAGVPTATFTTSTLAVGSHSIVAAYSGSTTFAASTSIKLTQKVSQTITTTTPTSSLNPVPFEQAVTFNAQVAAKSPGTRLPTGTVTFTDTFTPAGSTQAQPAAIIGTVTLNSAGVASLTTVALGLGKHSITIEYNGDSNFAASVSGVLVETVGTPNQFYVNSLFLKLLGRNADTGSLNLYAGQLDAATGGNTTQVRTSVVNAITSSQEYRQDTVNQIFLHYLGRSAFNDPSLAAFVNDLNSGTTQEQVAAIVAGSAEYFWRAGTLNKTLSPNAAFLNQLYKDALSRPADATANASFLPELNAGVSRTTVAFELLTSGEYDTNLVNFPGTLSTGGVSNSLPYGYFQMFLGRNAIGSEASGYASELGLGIPNEFVIAQVASTQECFTKSQPS